MSGATSGILSPPRITSPAFRCAHADIKPSQTLKSRGVEANFVDNKLVLHRSQSGHYQEPLYIVVGEQGKIDIAGRSLGRYQPAEKLAMKRELIGEIITFFDL